MRPRFAELDVFRGLACLATVVYHYTITYPKFFYAPQPALFKFYWGHFGYHLFFMISGFLILMNLERTVRPLDFIVSRCSRLLPAYWAAIILTFAVTNVAHFELAVSIKQALFNFTMLQDYWGVKKVDGVYWTLSVELAFYLLMFLIFIFKGLKYIEEWGLGWLILMALYKIGIAAHLLDVPEFVITSGLFKYGHLFVAGILFYNLKNKGHALHRYIALGLCFGIQCLLNDPRPWANVVIGGYFILFYLFIINALSWIVQKPLVFLGTISYSLYLIHQYFGYVVINYLYVSKVNGFLVFIIPVVLSIAVATFITFLIERPAMAFIRRKYKDWKGLAA